MRNKFCLRMNLLVLLMYVVGFYGCSSDYKPADLFVLMPGEQWVPDKVKERLKYGKLLQPEVSGDSLIVPEVKNVPVAYEKYANRFVYVVNNFLKKVPEEENSQFLYPFSSNVIGVSLMNTFVVKRDSLYVLNVEREAAIFLGLEKEYDKVRIFVHDLNQFLPNYSQDIVTSIETIYEEPRSIFWNPYYFNGTIKNFRELKNMVLNPL